MNRLPAVLFLAAFLTACGATGANPPAPVQPAIRPAAATGAWYHPYPRHGLHPRFGAGLLPATAFYPADLTNHKGPVQKVAQEHFVAVNCALSCWGAPIGFLANLEKSTMIHVVDQYVGSTSNNRYTNDSSVIPVTATLPNPAYFSDITTVLHTAISKVPGHPTGYGHEYHLFFKNGQNICFNINSCYAPGGGNFTFCAFHSHTDFNDYGHVIFSVEPFQDVVGCFENLIPGHSTWPNGSLADSTNSTLSHEMIETIIDPDGNAWYNSTSLNLNGYEIADECQTTAYDGELITLNNHVYQIQQEYSNKDHACMP